MHFRPDEMNQQWIVCFQGPKFIFFYAIACLLILAVIPSPTCKTINANVKADFFPPLSHAKVNVEDYARAKGPAFFPTRAFMVTTKLAHDQGKTEHALEEVRRHLPNLTKVELIYGSIGNFTDRDFGCESHNVEGNDVCRMSLTWAMHQIWRSIVRENLPSALILEDDVLFHDDFSQLLPQYWSRVPPDFEIVYLGCSPTWLIRNLEAPIDFVRIGSAPYTTHAYIVTAASAARFSALLTQMFQARGQSDEPELPRLSPVDTTIDLFLNTPAYQTALDKSKWVSFESTLSLPAKWRNVSFVGEYINLSSKKICKCDDEYTELCRGYLPVRGVGLAFQHHHCHNFTRLYSWVQNYQASL